MKHAKVNELAGEFLGLCRTVFSSDAHQRQGQERHGVRVSFADTTDPASVRRALRPETRLVLVETPTNPLLRVADLRQLAEITRQVVAARRVDAAGLDELDRDVGPDVLEHLEAADEVEVVVDLRERVVVLGHGPIEVPVADGGGPVRHVAERIGGVGDGFSGVFRNPRVARQRAALTPSVLARYSLFLPADLRTPETR